jgi:predicted nucleic acid-binding protein
MIRAVIDTNVLISAIIKPDGPAGPILKALGKGNFKLVFSPADYLVSGDSDLLALNKFEEVKIINPRDFLSIIHHD